MTSLFAINSLNMERIDIPAALRAFRRRMDLTQENMAQRLNLKRTTYTSYEQGQAQPPSKILEQLREMGFEEAGQTKIAAGQLLVPLPFIGTVSASSEVNWSDPLDTEEMEEVPPEMAGKGRFCCRVGSDSMYELLWPGDLAVFQKDPTPRIKAVIFYRTFENKVTIKQLLHNGRVYVLHPLNPAYDDIEAKGDCIGHLVGIVREHGSRRITVYDRHGIQP
jgi:SOS-response transcriptional repressor LexA